jgi:hypothetical protein
MASSVYTTPSALAPAGAQQAFPSNCTLQNDPSAAMYNYSRTMHAHTARQMDLMTRASRRRSVEGAPAPGPSSKGDSTSSPVSTA